MLRLQVKDFIKKEEKIYTFVKKFTKFLLFKNRITKMKNHNNIQYIIYYMTR